MKRMRNGKHAKLIFLTAITLVLILASPAVFAYLDPSTGSMVVSAIVGILASIALALKTYWYKIKGIFRRNDKQDDSSTETPD